MRGGNREKSNNSEKDSPLDLLGEGQVLLPGLVLLLEVLYVGLADLEDENEDEEDNGEKTDLDEEDAVDDVEHVEDAAHARRLDLDGRQASLGPALGRTRMRMRMRMRMRTKT